ncbi:MAG: FHA domain-containing protein [Pirellulales bacterium]|nr:FHA domain-containing protein [Pirellulales bacterium]
MKNFVLWIDAVGSYWVCLGDVVTLGRPGGEDVDVPILGDLSRRHARIRRDGEGYLIEALRDVSVDSHPVRPAAALTDGCQIELGGSVRLKFRRPHALSGTARLELAGSHRTQPTVNAVLLMADLCILGPRPHSHVLCRPWPREVFLFRHEETLSCRTTGEFEIDGRSCRDRGRMTLNSHVAGDGFSFKLEEI